MYVIFYRKAPRRIGVNRGGDAAAAALLSPRTGPRHRRILYTLRTVRVVGGGRGEGVSNFSVRPRDPGRETKISKCPRDPRFPGNRAFRRVSGGGNGGDDQ